MFDRLSVLVVEDSSFTSRMLNDILRSLEVGRVQLVKDGAAAVSLLRSVTKHEAAVGLLAFDIIIADYVMSPVNGAMLLRWIRQSPESPDRFLPVVMMSAASDSAKVHECRDLGATEFLAKPFSIRGIAEHLIGIVEHPRPFLHTHDYFGPDRRRQQRELSEPDRRVATREDIEIVYSAKKSRPENAQAKAFHYQLPNRLRDKIAGTRRDPLLIDSRILEAAEIQLDRMEADYADWVAGNIIKLKSACLRAKNDDPDKRPHYMGIINRIAHELRGQGTTFGYPLITEFARSLQECTGAAKPVDDLLLEVVRDHINGIAAVIRDRVKGMGGELGEALLRELQRARAKHGAELDRASSSLA